MKTRKEVNDFCDNFAFEFVTTSSVSDEFRMLTGADMKEIMVGLGNSLKIELGGFLGDDVGDD